MKVTIELLSDAILGDGTSIPGAEDISILSDSQGFPYFRGSTFKGILREEMIKYFICLGNTNEQAKNKSDELLGQAGNNLSSRIKVSNFEISEKVRQIVFKSCEQNADKVLQSITHLRTFVKVDEETGVSKDGSLRMARCINKGLILQGEIECPPECEDMIKEVLSLFKWIGTLRNKGFGKVKVLVK